MTEATFSIMDLIQIALLLLACHCCKVYGYQKGIVDTLDYFNKEGILEVPDEETIKKLEEEENEKR